MLEENGFQQMLNKYGKGNIRGYINKSLSRMDLITHLISIKLMVHVEPCVKNLKMVAVVFGL